MLHWVLMSMKPTIAGRSAVSASGGAPTLKDRMRERFGDRKGFIHRSDYGPRRDRNVDRVAVEIAEKAILQAAYAEHGPPAKGKRFPVIRGAKGKALEGIDLEKESPNCVVGRDDCSLLPYPKEWRHLTVETRVRFQQIALEDIGEWQTMTLHLSDGELRKMRASRKSHADYIRRKISQALRRELGHVPEYWFKIEYFSKPRRLNETYAPADPHVHGSIAVHNGISPERIRKALLKAGGFPGGGAVGRPPVKLKQSYAALANGWVEYVLETSPLEMASPPYPTSAWLRSLVYQKGRVVRPGTTACTRRLNGHAVLLYNLVRLKMLKERDRQVRLGQASS